MLYQISWGDRVTVMLKWSKGYERDNKIQMQNLLNMLRTNELEATYPLESRRKKISPFPPEQVQSVPRALLSSGRKTTVAFSWRGLESCSPPLTRGWHGPALNSPPVPAHRHSPWTATATGSQADAHRCRAPRLQTAGGAYTVQSTTDLSERVECDGLSLQPVILFISLPHENVLKKKHHYNHK